MSDKLETGRRVKTFLIMYSPSLTWMYRKSRVNKIRFIWKVNIDFLEVEFG